MDEGHHRGHEGEERTASSSRPSRAARRSQEQQCQRAHQRHVRFAAILPSSPSSIARAAGEQNGTDNRTSNPTPTRPANPPRAHQRGNLCIGHQRQYVGHRWHQPQKHNLTRVIGATHNQSLIDGFWEASSHRDGSSCCLNNKMQRSSHSQKFSTIILHQLPPIRSCAESDSHGWNRGSCLFAQCGKPWATKWLIPH